MAGGNLMYAAIGFIAGVVMADTVRNLAMEHLNFKIPAFYASYPADVDYPSTTSTSLAGSVYERDYGNANELNINHIPV